MNYPYIYKCIYCPTTKRSMTPLNLPAECSKCRIKANREATIRQDEKLNIDDSKIIKKKQTLKNARKNKLKREEKKLFELQAKKRMIQSAKSTAGRQKALIKVTGEIIKQENKINGIKNSIREIQI